MAKDAELDRLKSAQDHAFQKKQSAYAAQQQAWERRSVARDAMNRAHETKQRAYDDQDRAWQRYLSIKNANGSRIDWLNSAQESAYQNMKSAYDSASSAYERRDGASAKSYAADGARYKEESQRYVAERRGLVEEIRAARAYHEPAKLAFQRAKAQFDSCKQAFDAAKREHERTQETFKQAKAEFTSAAAAFKSRLEKVKADNKQRQDDKKSAAEKAGVPYRYRDDMYVSKDSEGNTNIYFGGVGKPDGPGHGHYVLDRYGKVTYKRDPFDPHGAQNFTETNTWHKMKMQLDYDTMSVQSDNYFGAVGETNQKSKAHVAVNDNGEIVYVRDVGGEVLYDKKNSIGELPDNLDWSK